MNSTESSGNFLDGATPPEENKFLIVGLGASAGGIAALKMFFEHVPADSGIAYVVILHLSPNHDSKLAEVIRVNAKLPVQQVNERIKVEPDNIYVVPPNQHLEMDDGHINVTANVAVEDRRAPIDIFFRTLGESHGHRAACVILSGTGADGSMGLKRVKEKGGAAFVQNPREAEFNEMPRHSIATDLVDAVLPVAEIPGHLISYKNNLANVQIRIENDQPQDQPNILRELLNELRSRTGHDFLNYKRPTLIRRIERRISLRNMPNLEAYVDFIRQNPEEVTALLKDLLISVTNFFRDRKPFESIELEILPVIFKKKQAEEQVRIWAAGCATGEEAYSIAMLCAEQTMDIIDAPKIQIFATDIDEDAIAHAREGFYTINDAADVSPERLRRFFSKDGDGYRIRRELREMVLFANHNFITDPPFSHLDLVTCRNVLIYLNRQAQDRVMETFHFALNPNGYLFVGTSESVDTTGNLYEVVSRDNHIFRSRPVSVRAFPVPESVPAFRADQTQAIIIKEKSSRLRERVSYGELHQQLLEQYAPPSLVINESYDIVHLSERAAPYLQFVAGEPSQNLLKVIKQDLRMDLRSALYQALQQKITVEARGLKIKINDTIETINIHVKPVLREQDLPNGFLLVIFERTENAPAGKEVILRSDESISRHLEAELLYVKGQLRGSNEQHEFQAEELKASNEELQAINEELRSAAEELETSKEELQSMNEELRTVNQELKVKIEETSVNSNNLQNLINSTSIGTIFLDRSFRIAMFTPAVRDIFNLIPADYGRPLSDITHRLQYNGLMEDAESVMEHLTVIEREVTTTDNCIFIMRVLPYRTAEDHINGVVVTFIDISKRKQAEESLRQSEEIYRTVLSSIDEGFCILEILFDENGAAHDAKYLDANDAFFEQTGLSKKVIGQPIRDFTSEIEFGSIKIYSGVALSGKSVRFEFKSRRLPYKGWFEAYAMRIGIPGKNHVAVFFNNISEHKYRELNAAFLVEVNDNFNRFTTTGDIMQAVGDKIQQYFNVTGITFAEVDEEKDEIVSIYNNHKHPDENDLIKIRPSDYAGEEWLTLQRAGEMIVVNDLSITKPGSTFTKHGSGAQLIAPFAVNRRLLFAIILTRNEAYTWRKNEIELLKELSPRIYQRLKRTRAEEELKKSEERLQKAFSIETVGVIFIKFNGKISGANEAFLRMYGYTQDDLTNVMEHWNELAPEEFKPHLLKVTEEILSHGQTTPYEKQYTRKDGTQWWALVSATRISDEEWVQFIIDITEQKLLQQRQDEFIAIASHELKTPVTSIKVYAEILEEIFENRNDDENTDLISKLNRQINRLGELISDLLDTTKIAEGHLALEFQKFDLNNLITDRIEELQRISQKHQIIFQPSQSQLITADKERISQVLTNLISNAIKYSPEGGEIIVVSEQMPAGVKVSVKDHGIGIPALLINNVFERFFRISNPKIQTYPGMGLGLYISAAIIKRHGGTIDVESTEGTGTVFRFILPYNNKLIS